jgi:hypothetical protein
MSYIEKGAALQALRAVLVALGYLWWIWPAHADGRLYGEGGLALLGRGVLWLIAATVLAGIAVQILVSILSVATKEESGPDFQDERERQIERRALETGFVFVGLGFFGAMAALALGWPAAHGFHLMLAGMVACDAGVNLLKFRAYRRGF